MNFSREYSYSKVTLHTGHILTSLSSTLFRHSEHTVLNDFKKPTTIIAIPIKTIAIAAKPPPPIVIMPPVTNTMNPNISCNNPHKEVVLFLTIYAMFTSWNERVF